MLSIYLEMLELFNLVHSWADFGYESVSNELRTFANAKTTPYKDSKQLLELIEQLDVVLKSQV
jgi:hypothetical protein